MPVEDHPLFPEWKARLEKLIKAKEAFDQGEATQADVDAAIEKYTEIADEV